MLRHASAALCLLMLIHVPTAQAGIAWQTQWNQALFAKARAEHRYVLLDLHAVWCHWCHVMDDQTYANPEVQKLIAADYLPVSVDADSDPALSARYGDWGWPATIVLAPDGSEIVKRRGYIPAPGMIAMLKAIVADPSPGPSVQPAMNIVETQQGQLDPAQHKKLDATFDQAYDVKYGGWGNLDKYLDADATELLLERARDGDQQAARRARQTLDQNLKLIDPVWGGVDQYADQVDWSGPHFEKLMSYQAGDLRLYAEAWALWKDPKYLQAAKAIRGYIQTFLTAPDGAFYTSQDADLSQKIPGAAYYAHDDAGRRKLGIPHVDQHEYTRENGWAITALCKYHDVSGDADALKAALRAAQWVLAHRALPGGGFAHGADKAAPALDDTLATGRAFLDLYRSTGTRIWLTRSEAALDFIDKHFRDSRGGYFDSAPAAKAIGVFAKPVRSVDHNTALVRLANLAYHYSGDARYQNMARYGMRYLTAPALMRSGRSLPGILLANRELGHAPIHITVVGGKNDSTAQALHAAALRYPAHYLRVDWWDRSEGKLPNPDVQYPKLSEAAAFACTDKACSSPVFKPSGLAATVNALRKTLSQQGDKQNAAR